MYRYSVPCYPRITLAAFLAHFFLQDYREGATPFAPAGRFQSTCPRRGTTIPESKLEDSDDWFQSTLPRGERLIPADLFEVVSVFQSTLPRGERPCGILMIVTILIVSIHAPTRGATGFPGRFPAMPLFQSTLPRGERRESLISIVFMPFVSIHAPTRGATLPHLTKRSPYARFQSTLPRGERHVMRNTRNRLMLFQSTLPRGERLFLDGISKIRFWKRTVTAVM